MFKSVFAVVLLSMVNVVVVSAADDISKPEIKVETRINNEGKKIPYMYIDGIMVHETDPAKQPQPPIVTPGDAGKAGVICAAPSDAVVLFDGTAKSMSEWTDEKGNPSKWKLVNGVLESVKKAGMIQTKQKFGSCQLHVEWASPSVPKGNGQKRGNSGLFLQGIYEIQILDSYNNITYPDGQAGALYGRNKPLVNACRKPGVWQSYDVIFHRPIFKDGKVVREATFTVLQNGVLIQDHTVLYGGTHWISPHAVSDYRPHADKLPIKLQDHGNPVRFRNIWIRELED